MKIIRMKKYELLIYHKCNILYNLLIYYKKNEKRKKENLNYCIYIMGGKQGNCNYYCFKLKLNKLFIIIIQGIININQFIRNKNYL